MKRDYNLGKTEHDIDTMADEEKNTADENKSNNVNDDFFFNDMKELVQFTNWLERQSLLVKLLFCIPVLDVVWGIYRLFKALVENNTAKIIIAVLLLVPGTTITWLIDLVWVLIKRNGFWF